MSSQNLDMSVLASNAKLPTQPNLIPRPGRRWKTRVLLPAAILLCFAGVFAYTLRDTFLPATPVKTVAVVTKMASGGNAAGVVAQAAGWVEPDPYPIYVTALADGIVKEVKVLEGQPVKAGDVVVTLIDEDAKLALEFAEAELQHHTHDICDYTAMVKAAQADWDHPTERIRAVKAAEAMLAQTKGDLAAYSAELVVERARVKELEEQFRREELAAKQQAINEFQKVQTELKLATQRAMVQF